MALQLLEKKRSSSHKLLHRRRSPSSINRGGLGARRAEELYNRLRCHPEQREGSFFELLSHFVTAPLKEEHFKSFFEIIT